MSFTSQYGLVDVNSLPVISEDNVPMEAKSKPVEQSVAPNKPVFSHEEDIFVTIEKLTDLKNKGILTDDEYNAKKAELLGRL